MFRVGQNTRKGQHLTRLESNSNQFKTVLNSYIGCNSVFNNCYEYRNVSSSDVSERYRQAITGYALQPMATINGKQSKSIWNEWPTIEESFKAHSQKHQMWSTISSLEPIDGSNKTLKTPYIRSKAPEIAPMAITQWTTGFWDNINKLSEMKGIQSPDINNNNIVGKYGSESMSTPNYGYNDSYNEWLMSYTRSQAPIETDSKSSFPTEKSFGSISTVNDNSMANNVSNNLFGSFYVQPKIRRRKPSLVECVFCKNNNESPEFYKSHILKDPESNIQCPVLRAYNCPICHNGGGPKAHTIRYCPLNKAGFHSKLERLIRCQYMERQKLLDTNDSKNLKRKIQKKDK